MRIYALVVQADFRAMGDIYAINIDDSEKVYDLKKEAKQTLPQFFAGVDEVWRTEGEMTLTCSKG